MKKEKRLISFVLCMSIVLILGGISIPPMTVSAAPTCYQQSDSRWGGVYFGNWNIAESGCGILSTVNAVNYLTGNFIQPTELAAWAYNNKHYNGPYGQGTVRSTFYADVTAAFGNTYGFKVTNLTWGNIYNAAIKNHLLSGGAVIVHVPNHFMAITSYNASTQKYLVYDSSAAAKRNTSVDGSWLTADQIHSNSLTKVDWFCLVTATGVTTNKLYTTNAVVASGSGSVHFGNNVTSAQVTAGTVVNFQTTPASGYKVSQILVGGTAFEIQNNGEDCVYQFTMPQGNCDVVVTFSKAAEASNIYPGKNIASVSSGGDVYGFTNDGVQVENDTDAVYCIGNYTNAWKNLTPDTTVMNLIRKSPYVVVEYYSPTVAGNFGIQIADSGSNSSTTNTAWSSFAKCTQYSNNEYAYAFVDCSSLSYANASSFILHTKVNAGNAKVYIKNLYFYTTIDEVFSTHNVYDKRIDTGSVTFSDTVWYGYENITFQAKSNNQTGSDWVGIYPVDVTPSTQPSIAWVCLSGDSNNTVLWSDMRKGEAYDEYVSNGVIKAGEYKVCLMWNDNGGFYDNLCEPVKFTITEGSIYPGKNIASAASGGDVYGFSTDGVQVENDTDAVYNFGSYTAAWKNITSESVVLEYIKKSPYVVIEYASPTVAGNFGIQLTDTGVNSDSANTVWSSFVRCTNTDATGEHRYALADCSSLDYQNADSFILHAKVNDTNAKLYIKNLYFYATLDEAVSKHKVFHSSMDEGTITLEKKAWDSSENVIIKAKSQNQTGSDWVGIYPIDGTPSAMGSIAWVCLNGSEENIISLPSMIKGSSYDKYVLNGKLRSGEYNIYLAWNDAEGFYDNLCEPVKITVKSVSFEQEMLDKGFPESYIPYLTALHEDHPYWEFESVDITGMNSQYTFDYVVSQEDVGSRNLVTTSTWAPSPWNTLGQANYSPYYHETDTTLYDSGFRRASNEAVRYFLDPRNFLNDKDIFMFETLEFNENIHTLERVSAALSGSFMGNDALCDNGMTYAQHIYNCGKLYNVSSVSLAARLKQEQGTGGSPLVEGTIGTTLYNYYVNKPDTDNGSIVWGTVSKTDVFDTDTLLGYNGLYNFFNIQASGTGKFAIYLNAAKEAQAGGWTSKASAISGGAKKFASTYVGDHQDTLYFQKFNVDPRSSRNFWGQYMQNIAAALTEGRSTRTAYANSGILERAFVFKIPVYDGMPSEACADPAQGNSYYSASESTGAVFGSDSYNASITVAAGEGTAYFKDLNSTLVQSGTSLNVQIAPAVGYKVSQVKVNGKLIELLNDGQTATYTLLMPPQDLTVVVEFESYISQTLGDVNGDGKTDITDLICAKKYVDKQAGTVVTVGADANGNNLVNSEDIGIYREYLLGGKFKSFWADSDNMKVNIGEDGKGKASLVSTESGIKDSHIYLNGQSSDVYLSADYTTIFGNNSNCNFFGITIRQGEESRQIGFQNTGVIVRSNYTLGTDGIPDITNGVYTYNTAGNDYVWAQNTAAAYGPVKQSVVSNMIATAGTYNLEWAIIDGTLYLSIDDESVLHLPLTKLCTEWTADLEYQIGFATWEPYQNGAVEISNIERCFGEEAVAKVVTDKTVDFATNVSMSYDVMTGTYLPKTGSGSARAYGEAQTGKQSVSTTIKLVDADNNGSAGGITVRVLDENSAELGSAQIVTEKGSSRIQKNYVWGTPEYFSIPEGATRFDSNGVCKTTAVINSGELTLYYNGTLVFTKSLADLDIGYVDGYKVQLGICSWDANNGLMMFEDTKFETWSDSNRMKVVGGESGAEVQMTEIGSGSTYMYLGEASNNVYLAANYGTHDVINTTFLGLTIKQGDQSRQVGFQNSGITVQSQHGWAPNNGTGVPNAGTNVFIYNTAGDSNPYVIRQSTVTNYGVTAKSLISDMTACKTENSYYLEWAIADGVLYASINHAPVLKMPLSALCADWTKDLEYQVGFNIWDANANCALTITDIEAYYGDEAVAAFENQVTFAETSGMTYNPIDGYVPDFGSKYAYGAAVAGEQGIRTTITLADKSNTNSASGITVKSGNQSAQIYVAAYSRTVRIQVNHGWGTPLDVTAQLPADITPYDENGVCNMSAIIKDGKLYVFFNGAQAGSVELYKLLPGYKATDAVQLGITTWDSVFGLSTFTGTEFLTADEVNAIETTYVKWDVAFLVKSVENAVVDYANGTITQKLNTTAVTKFHGTSTTWEINGSMNRLDALAGQLAQGFRITVGEQEFLVYGQHKGICIPWNYNYNGGNNALAFNPAIVSYFGDNKTTDTIAFKAIIANDTLYVWFDDVPSWKIPLTSAIYSTDGENTELFAGFAAGSAYNLALQQAYSSDACQAEFQDITVETGDAVDLSRLADFH